MLSRPWKVIPNTRFEGQRPFAGVSTPQASPGSASSFGWMANAESSAAQLCPPWRPRGRYEDLSLALMLARLERDWLSQSGRRLAGWAMPWGAAPRAKLEADIGHLDGALKRLGRWLPRRSIAMAECNARQRVAAITVELGELDPRARAALAAVPQGPATEALRVRTPFTHASGSDRWALPARRGRRRLPARLPHGQRPGRLLRPPGRRGASAAAPWGRRPFRRKRIGKAHSRSGRVRESSRQP